ncbi:MAG: YcgN family cysteine cluster protein [Roseiarcus sp.]
MTDFPADEPPFWRAKTLDEMSAQEWESLCDGCGRCCLVKLEDEDTGEIHFTDIGCKLLDAESCRCIDYPRRARRVADCVKLTPDVVRALSWLPSTCAYRVLAEGRDLAWWHPLVSGSAATVHQAGVSVRGRVSAAEQDVPVELWPERIVKWPNRPARRRGAAPELGGDRRGSNPPS